jgi:hypothetical protein
MCVSQTSQRTVNSRATNIVVFAACLGLLLMSCSLCDVGNFRETPGAMQIEYRHGVPHSDQVGHLQLETDANSFFPIGVRIYRFTM